MSYPLKILVFVLLFCFFGEAFAAPSKDRREEISRVIDQAGTEAHDASPIIEEILKLERDSGITLTRQEILWKLRKFEEDPRTRKKRRCFTCGMRVLTPAGYVVLDYLQSGDVVYSWDEQNQRLVENEIAQIHEAREVEYGVLKNTPTQVNLEVTADHPFLIPDGGGEYKDLNQVLPSENLRGLALNGNKCDLSLVARGNFQIQGKAKVKTLAMKNLPHNFIVEGLVVHNKPIF